MQRAAFWKIGAVALVAANSVVARADEIAAPEAGSDARAYVTYGMSNGRQGNLDTAISAFNQAIKLDPTFAPAYFNRAMAYDQKSSYALALQDLTKTVEVDPNFIEAYYHRGRIEGMQGNFDDAISDFKKVIEVNPKFAPAQYNLGHAYYFKGDLPNALDRLNEAIKIDPNYSVAYFIRGLVQRGMAHKLEPLGDFQKSAGLDLPNASLWIWITEIEAGQKDQAQKDLTDAVGSPRIFKPDDWLTQVANFLLGKLPEDQLLQAVNRGKGTELKDRQCQAWYYIAISRKAAGDTAGANDAFTKAVATNSTSSEEYIEASRELSKVQPPTSPAPTPNK